MKNLEITVIIQLSYPCTQVEIKDIKQKSKENCMLHIIWKKDLV